MPAVISRYCKPLAVVAAPARTIGVAVTGTTVDVAGGAAVSDGAAVPILLIFGKGVPGWQAARAITNIVTMATAASRPSLFSFFFM